MQVPLVFAMILFQNKCMFLFITEMCISVFHCLPSYPVYAHSRSKLWFYCQTAPELLSKRNKRNRTQKSEQLILIGHRHQHHFTASVFITAEAEQSRSEDRTKNLSQFWAKPCSSIANFLRSIRVETQSVICKHKVCKSHFGHYSREL